MTIANFVSEITKQEGKKSSVSVGNVREILRLTNKKTGGKLYKFIKEL